MAVYQRKNRGVNTCEPSSMTTRHSQTELNCQHVKKVSEAVLTSAAVMWARVHTGRPNLSLHQTLVVPCYYLQLSSTTPAVLRCWI